MLTACLAALASSCHNAPASQAELHCFHTRGHDDQGINPLLGAFVSCFDDAAACEAHANAETTCTATLPRWHCFGMPSSPHANDPLDGLTFCYPSLALCDAARTPRFAPDDHAPVRTPCKPVDTVYCAAGELAGCADSEALCNRAGQMIAATLVGAPPAAPCVARHSVH